MSHSDDHAAVVGVGGEQPSPDEDVQFSGHRLRQAIPRDPPPSGATLLIDGDQPQQSGNDLLAASAGGRGRVGQGRIGLAGQGTLDPAELVIACSGQFAAAVDTVGELGEGEGQQR